MTETPGNEEPLRKTHPSEPTENLNRLAARHHLEPDEALLAIWRLSAELSGGTDSIAITTSKIGIFFTRSRITQESLTLGFPYSEFSALDFRVYQTNLAKIWPTSGHGILINSIPGQRDLGWFRSDVFFLPYRRDECAEIVKLLNEIKQFSINQAGAEREGRADTGELLSCSFCGKNQKQVKKLIAGPDVFICNGCIHRVHTVLATAGKTVSAPITTIRQVSDEDREKQCRFCGKPRRDVEAMAEAGEARICNECLDLCDEILSDELA